MAYEFLKLFQQVELDIQTGGPMLFQFSTDIPGDAMTVRWEQMIDTSDTTAGRVPVNVRLPGSTKGRQVKARISGNYIVRLFGARVFMKILGTPAPTGWVWAPIPIDVTPDLFSDFKLPIPETASTFADFKLPIPPTSSEFAEFKLPIPPTASEFTQMKMPLRESDTLFEWVTLPMDAME